MPLHTTQSTVMAGNQKVLKSYLSSSITAVKSQNTVKPNPLCRLPVTSATSRDVPFSPNSITPTSPKLPVQRSFGEVGVMEFGLKGTSRLVADVTRSRHSGLGFTVFWLFTAVLYEMSQCNATNTDDYNLDTGLWRMKFNCNLLTLAALQSWHSPPDKPCFSYCLSFQSSVHSPSSFNRGMVKTATSQNGDSQQCYIPWTKLGLSSRFVFSATVRLF